jgi:hypothetical protein
MITVFLMVAYRYYSWASYSLFHLEGDFGSLYLLIPAAIVELFILYKVVKHSRINRNAAWSKVIALVVLTDLLYLAVCSILLYLAVAVSLWLGYSDRL